MADDQFANFEDEFQTITAALSRKLGSIPDVDVAQKRRLIDDADTDIRDANASLQKIEQEMRHAPYNIKAKAQQRLSVLRDELEDYVKRLQAIKREAGPANMPAGLTGRDRDAWRDNRRQLLEAKSTVDESGESIARTMAALEETHERGAATSGTLLEQREQLLRARETIRETDDFLVKSAKTLRRMRRRIMTNKIVQFIIILVEAAIVALIVYIKYYR